MGRVRYTHLMDDLIGRRFGRLLVIATGAKYRHYICKCDCGRIRMSVYRSSLIRGTTGSCGCIRKEILVKRNIATAKHGHYRGNFGTPTYWSWMSMKARCTNPGTNGYGRYGGRGITFCPEWSDFSNFLRDMGERPEGMTLDREDPDGNYEPGNCRWANATTQRLNRGTRSH